MAVTLASSYALWQARILAPALAALSEESVLVFLEEAMTLPEAVWNAADYPYAVIYYAAHQATLELSGTTTGLAPGGPVTSRKAGGTSIGYASYSANPASDDGNFGQTQYGRMYLALRRRQLSAHAVFVGI